MTMAFRPAKRVNVPLLISLAGGTGSGKTLSALLLAKGLAGGRPFYGLDTENGRMLHYADDFEFMHGEIRAPFRPERYADAIDSAIKDAKEPRPVVVVDSFSHEHAGEGGLLDWHEDELQRMAGDDGKKRKAMTFAAWIAPKQAHKAMVNRLLQVNAHIIICLRAQESIEIVKVNGETVVRPKQSLIGADGWIPISEKTLPYEMTMSFLLTADAPGIPKPIKLQSQHRPLVPLDAPLTEETGRLLAGWAAGSSSGPEPRDERGATPKGADAASTLPPPTGASSGPDVPPITAAQKKKLNVLVGELRDKGGHITTTHLYHAVDRVPVDGEDGRPHWGPLRDSLSKDEASGLIDRLEKFAASLAEAAA